jgi:hypothetical protein
MNGYKVFSFQTEEGNRFLVLDAIVPDIKKKQVFLQGFVLNSECYPFPLHFLENFPDGKLLEEAFEDGSNHVKDIKNWSGEKIEASLELLSLKSDFLNFIRTHCKSTKLLEDIDRLVK